MKRPLIITIGIIFILLVLGLWLYLIVFGTPKSTRDVFANLGVVSSSSVPINNQEPSSAINLSSTASTTAQLALNGSNLQQLTTRSVAGFGFVLGSSQTIIRYVERGTGYVYQIDTNSGVEKQISITTLPQTARAIFSPSGTNIVFISYDGYTKNASVGSLSISSSSSTAITLHTLPLNADNLAFKNDTILYYTLDDGSHTIGYSYNLNTLTSTKLFTFNARDMGMVWGDGLSQMYIETKPAASLDGYAYTASTNTFNSIGMPKPGLTMLMNNEYTIETYASSSEYVSLSQHEGIQTDQPIMMIPEKCIFKNATDSALWCGAPLTNTANQYLEQWYKGILTSNDYLWYTDLNAQRSIVIADLSTLSGRTIDVTGLTVNNDNTRLLFANKIDGMLWMFKIQS